MRNLVVRQVLLFPQRSPCTKSIANQSKLGALILHFTIIVQSLKKKKKKDYENASKSNICI